MKFEVIRFWINHAHYPLCKFDENICVGLLLRFWRPNREIDGQTRPNTRVLQAVGWCRGWNRNVEGWWGFLQLTISKFKVSKFQILTNPFHLFDRYWSRPSPRLSINYLMDLQDYSAPDLAFFNFLDFRSFEIFKSYSSKMTRDSLFGASWCLQR